MKKVKETANNKNNLDKFEEEIRRTPLYELKKQIKQATFELEMLKEDPSTNHDEIAEIDSKLANWKHEYAKRVADFKTGLI